MTYTNTITEQSKTLVDSNNTLWHMDYSGYDNTVVITSDKATNLQEGNPTFAVLSQYSLDNALGHSIPDAILYSAESMLVDDDDSLLSVALSHVAKSKQYYA